MTASPRVVPYPDCTPGIRHFFLPAASECGCGALVRPLATGAEATLFQPNPALRSAFLDAYEAMDAATKWAAGETAGVKTLADADRHIAGYDALLDAQVRAGQALGILSKP